MPLSGRHQRRVRDRVQNQRRPDRRPDDLSGLGREVAMSTTAQTIDEAKLDDFMGRFVGDLGAALSAALVVIGDRLGLYRAMADGEPVTPEQLARRTGTDARYVREWLSNQAAGGYVGYDPGQAAFSLSPEQAFALA